MNKKFYKNAKVEQLTKMLGTGVCLIVIPYSGKFSLGSYFRDFADCIQSRENKNCNNLFQQKFVLSNLISICRVFKRVKFVCYYCWFVERYNFDYMQESPSSVIIIVLFDHLIQRSVHLISRK